MKRLILYTILFLVSTTIYSQGGPPFTATISDGNWSDVNIWDNGLPNTTRSATINHNVTIDANAITKDLTINGTLNNNGFLLEVIKFINNGTYNDNSGTVEVRQNGSVSGNVTYFYNFNSRGGAINNTVYIKNLLTSSTGVLNITSGAVTLLNDGTYDGRVGESAGTITGNFTWQKYLDRSCAGWTTYSFPVDGTLTQIDLFHTFSGWYNTYYYDETFVGDLNLGWTPYTTSSDLVSQGYGIIHYNNAFTKTISLSTSLSSTFSWALDYTNSGDATQDGWNLVGNPHPGTIDWDAGGWTKNGVSGAIYTWVTCSNDYGSYVSGVGTNGMDQYIPSGEAFWVQATAASAQLSAPKSVIVNNSDAQLKGRTIQEFRIGFGNDETVVVIKRGTNSFDNEYDAHKMGVGRVYTKMVDEDDTYSINSIGKRSEIVELWTNGNGTMVFSDNLPNNYSVYIHDLLYDEVTKITTNTYTVSGNGNGYGHRYNLIFKNNNGTPVYNGQLQKGIQVNTGTYDIYGRKVDDMNRGGVYFKYDEDLKQYGRTYKSFEY